MCAPLFLHSYTICPRKPDPEEDRRSFIENFFRGILCFAGFFSVVLLSSTFDTLISITSLVLGILGACSVIAMPAIAAYTLIGISCAITILWLSIIIQISISCIKAAREIPNGQSRLIQNRIATH